MHKQKDQRRRNGAALNDKRGKQDTDTASQARATAPAALAAAALTPPAVSLSRSVAAAMVDSAVENGAATY